MLFLVFHLGAERYAIPATSVREIVPYAGLKAVLQSSGEIAGILDYHGNPVPVVDLVRIATREAAARTLSTRIILVSYGDSGDCIFGLIAEKVRDVRHFDSEAFGPSMVQASRTPWLGKILDEDKIIQWEHPTEIFPHHVLMAQCDRKDGLTEAECTKERAEKIIHHGGS